MTELPESNLPKYPKEFWNLTPRERDVYNLVVHGIENKEIAENLDITVKCVKYHLTHIYRKFNVPSRYQLMFKHHANLIPVPSKIEEIRKSIQENACPQKD